MLLRAMMCCWTCLRTANKLLSLHQYSCSVDKDSLAKESGLRVGDQVLDVNGHSFVNIIHAEAVTILRSYPTLIMTIKVNLLMVWTTCSGVSFLPVHRLTHTK